MPFRSPLTDKTDPLGSDFGTGTQGRHCPQYPIWYPSGTSKQQTVPDHRETIPTAQLVSARKEGRHPTAVASMRNNVCSICRLVPQDPKEPDARAYGKQLLLKPARADAVCSVLIQGFFFFRQIELAVWRAFVIMPLQERETL